jgi:ferrous iron transport protein A
MNAPLPLHIGHSTTLHDLRPGAQALVTAISGHGPVRRRLLEMGLCNGTEIEVIRRAPLGDPIEVRVRGYLLSMRNDQAMLVRVLPAQVVEPASLLSA